MNSIATVTLSVLAVSFYFNIMAAESSFNKWPGPIIANKERMMRTNSDKLADVDRGLSSDFY